MNKRIFFFNIIALMFVGLLISCNKEFPEPIFVEFEKQEVIPNYDWKIISPNGISQNFIAKRGKVVFLYKWSQHNEGAVEMLDILNVLYDKYKTKIEFVFVTDDSQIEVREFINEHEYIFPVFFSLSPMPNPIRSEDSLVGCLVSKKGRVVVLDKGLVNWNSKQMNELIEGLLKQ